MDAPDLSPTGSQEPPQQAPPVEAVASAPSLTPKPSFFKALLLPILGVIVLSLGVGALVATYLTMTKPPRQPAPIITITPTATPLVPQPTATAGPITVKGTIDCLPFKETKGPKPLSCAMALKTDNGSFYALSFANQQDMINAQGGSLVQVTGTLTPQTEPSPYKSQGTITVSSVTLLEKPTAPESQ